MNQITEHALDDKTYYIISDAKMIYILEPFNNKKYTENKTLKHTNILLHLNSNNNTNTLTLIHYYSYNIKLCIINATNMLLHFFLIRPVHFLDGILFSYQEKNM